MSRSNVEGPCGRAWSVRRWLCSMIVLTPLALGACQQNPETAHVVVEPRTAPARTLTNFDESLRCMDELFVAKGQKGVYVTSAGIPDATGQIAAGTKEMLITAISKMSARSGAFHYVDFDPTQSDVFLWEQMIGPKAVLAPRYYIRGAITQLDSNVLNSAKSAGATLPFVDLNIARDQVVSIMSLDLNIGELTTRQILPGMSANNSIAVVRAGTSGQVGGVIGKAGVSFNMSFDRAEGYDQAVRSLVELSAIESLGRLTHVPYWRCLAVDAANPAFRAQAREWFDAMSESERLTFARSALVRAGYNPGQATQASEPQFKDALARYQSERDIIPTGRIDFDFYYRVLAAGGVPQDAAASTATADALPPPAPQPQPQPQSAPTAAAPTAAAPRLMLITGRGGNSTYHVHETLALQAVVDQDAFLYCYYKDAEGTVARIFPNRYSPDALVHAQTIVSIPPKGNPFSISFDKGDVKEELVCVSSSQELGLKLPEALKAQDLSPLPVADLANVVAEFKKLGGAAPVADAWVRIAVVQ